MTTTQPVEIQVTLRHMFSAFPGRRPQNHYACDGPDGQHFTNSDKGTLTQVLRRKYGSVKLVVDDQRQPTH